ncbi:MAG: HAD family hydrolase [Spirochaetes bacterium]|nr:HAD family hydrolase [Spirochaetota bacterium]
MAIKAVGFDLDGTLYPAWRLYALSCDLALRHPGLYVAYGQARRILRKAGEGKPFPEGWKKKQAAFVALRLGIDPDQASQKIDSFVYEAMAERFAFLAPYSGVGPCLHRLATCGLRLGLLSDLPPKAKLEAMGLSSRFETALCSEDYGILKPSAFPFQALAEALGSAPDEMVYVGNKYGYDCAGAKALGMRTALFGRGGGPQADFSFRSWEKLADWILDQARKT